MFNGKESSIPHQDDIIKFIDELQASLSDKAIRLTLSEPVIDLLAEKGYDPKMGARPLSRKIDELIRVPLSKKILFEGLTDCAITATLDGEAVKFDMDALDPVPMVNDEGIIVLE